MRTHSQNTLPGGFIQFFEKIRRQPPFLVAVSGGVDSVVLCHLCQEAGFPFTILHCNFGLRGAESDRDEAFVRSLAEKYEVDVMVRKFQTTDYAEEKKLSIQEAARELRYQWFLQISAAHDFRYHTLLGHHADDNLETLLMNFFRGTGLQGLTGMPEARSYLLRPLLQTRREEILKYARQHHLKWVEDSSNSSSKYTRNYFRNEIIPAIRKVFPQVDENLLGNIERFKKINSLYETSVRNALDDLCEQNHSEIRIPVRKLLKYPVPAMVFEIIRPFGFGEKQVDDVIGLLSATSGKYVENASYQIIRHRNWLVISPKTEQRETIVIEKDQEEVDFEQGRMHLKTIPREAFCLKKSESLAQLDARHIDYPLLLRRWKPGDYFYPLGMKKKKKIARFFIDRKLSKNQKEETWVLESGKRIIWVVGLRIDDRFRISDNTRSVLEITVDR